MKHTGLLPQGKNDVHSAFIAGLASDEAILSVADELCTWIEDINCPVAQQLMMVFALKFDVLKDTIVKYLNSASVEHYGIKDSMLFSYYFMSKKDRTKWKYCISALERIAKRPFENERSQGLDTYANDILRELTELTKQELQELGD